VVAVLFCRIKLTFCCCYFSTKHWWVFVKLCFVVLVLLLFSWPFFDFFMNGYTVLYYCQVKSYVRVWNCSWYFLTRFRTFLCCLCSSLTTHTYPSHHLFRCWKVSVSHGGVLRQWYVHSSFVLQMCYCMGVVLMAGHSIVCCWKNCYVIYSYKASP